MHITNQNIFLFSAFLWNCFLSQDHRLGDVPLWLGAALHGCLRVVTAWGLYLWTSSSNTAKALQLISRLLGNWTQINQDNVCKIKILPFLFLCFYATELSKQDNELIERKSIGHAVSSPQERMKVMLTINVLQQPISMILKEFMFCFWINSKSCCTQVLHFQVIHFKTKAEHVQASIKIGTKISKGHQHQRTRLSGNHESADIIEQYLKLGNNFSLNIYFSLKNCFTFKKKY